MRIYIFININRRGGAKSKLRDLFLSSKFHNERVLYFWIFSAIFAYHLHPLYFCAFEFSINAWTSEWWIIEPVLIKDKPHRIHRMRFAFALFINKWTDLAKFSSFFYEISYVSTIRYDIPRLKMTTYARTKVWTITFSRSHLRCVPRNSQIVARVTRQHLPLYFPVPVSKQS